MRTSLLASCLLPKGLHRLESLPLFVMVALTLPKLLAQAPCVEMQGKVAAENRIVRDFKRPRPIALRRGDLEQQVVNFEFFSRYRDAKALDHVQVACVEVYEVIPTGFHVEHNVIDSVGVDVDDDPSWLVGYSCKTGEVFGLYGFAHPSDGFNGLMKLLDLKPVTDVDRALDTFHIYSRLIYPTGELVVNDELGLMHAALGYFRDRVKTGNFEAFWRTCPQSIKRHIAPPSVLSIGQGFSVTFFTLNDGKIDENSLLISRDNQTSDVRSKTIFSWGGRVAHPLNNR